MGYLVYRVSAGSFHGNEYALDEDGYAKVFNSVEDACKEYGVSDNIGLNKIGLYTEKLINNSNLDIYDDWDEVMFV